MADSIRTKIRKATFFGLEQITTANGYKATIGDEYEDERTPEQMVNDQSVNVTYPLETYLTAETGGAALGFLVKQLQTNFSLYVKDITNIRDTELKLLYGIEKYFLTNYDIPDSTGNPTVPGNTHITVNKPVGIDSERPYGRIDIEMETVYRQNVLDPESKLQATSIPSFNELSPSSVPISRRDTLLDATIYNLEQISGMGDVFKLQVSNEVGKNYPYVNVVPEPEEYLNAQTSIHQDFYTKKELTYLFDCRLNAQDDMLEEKEILLAKIESRFMNNFTIPDSTGRRTCTECMFLDNTFLGMEVNKPYGGLQVRLKTFYRQNLTDPAQPVNP